MNFQIGEYVEMPTYQEWRAYLNDRYPPRYQHGYYQIKNLILGENTEEMAELVIRFKEQAGRWIRVERSKIVVRLPTRLLHRIGRSHFEIEINRLSEMERELRTGSR